MAGRLSGAAGAIVFAMSLFAKTASGQPIVDTYINAGWHNMTQAACLDLASDAVDRAIGVFSIEGAETQRQDWFVLADTNADLVFWVFCIADDETDALVAGPGATERVLVQIIVGTTRASEFAEELRDYLDVCMAGGCLGVTTPGGPLAATQITWSDAAGQYRGRNGERLGFICPSLGNVPMRVVWGTDIYTDDSAICMAAVHAGVITTAGGAVTIEIRPGQEAYQGAERNGVTSERYGIWGGSYRFVPPASPTKG